jgi:oligoendopeptidase F
MTKTKTVLRPAFASMLLTLWISGAIAAPTAPADNVKDRWNLADIYQTQADFDADAVKLTAQLKQFAGCKGHLGDSAARFKACLDLNAEIAKRFARLAVYGTQYFDQDTGDSLGNQLNQRAQLLYSEQSQATAFFQPEILALGAKRINAMVAGNAGLKLYRFELDNMLRTAPHTLDSASEQMLSQFSLATSSSTSIYETLANSNMPWPTVKLSDGSEVKLDQAAYTQYRERDNRADRKLVFDAFWGKWKEFERTFGETLYGELKSDAAYAHVRHYPDSMAAALDANNIPSAVYKTLIAETNANLPTLHRYFKLRARMLGVSDLAYYDIYAPLIKSDRSFALPEGKQMMLAAVEPLGPDYVKTLSAATEARWMDVYPRPHKEPGAHMSGDAYDVHPFVLLNYTGNYDSVSTLTHEWGHAMHSVLANKTQASIYAPYSNFIAEIASTTNEALLLDHMLKVAKTDDERLLYLGAALEGLRGTFFRQAMLAEFEAAIHAKVDQGGSLTGEEITAIYDGILKRYHGDAEGVMKIDPAYAVEWAYIPHFYNAYYVFQYATSIAAAQDFSQRIIAGEPGVRERYLKMLSSGGSAYPYDLIKAAGVDLATAKPYQALAARMNAIMDQIEAIEAKRGK